MTCMQAEIKQLSGGDEDNTEERSPEVSPFRADAHTHVWTKINYFCDRKVL